ncbi:MAG TPA: hypothetical protein VFJ16_08475 [Longimicrobium sp.]|nr:hypothetical protein [Longimicrobium sp.]
MALREFRDSGGNEWLVWDVPPARSYAPARSGQDRRVSPTPGFAPERRMARDRRRRGASAGLERGWVCFQCESEKRRLAPPPADWQTAPDEELEALCRAAAPARAAT